MKLNRKFFAAAGCAGVLAFAITGCSKEAAQAETPVQTEAVTEAVAEEVTEAAESEEETNAESAEAESAENAEAAVSETISVWGPIVSVEEGSILIDNQSGISSEGEMLLMIGEDTKVLDGENGLPVELSALEEGETIYVNIGQAMTMSLPPQTNAEMIICQVPEDAKAPAYVQVVEMEMNAEDNYELVASNGETYQVAADCQILPYLTRNIVTLEDVNAESNILIWSDEENNAQKLVLFAE